MRTLASEQKCNRRGFEIERFAQDNIRLLVALRQVKQGAFELIPRLAEDRRTIGEMRMPCVRCEANVRHGSISVGAKIIRVLVRQPLERFSGFRR